VIDLAAAAAVAQAIQQRLLGCVERAYDPAVLLRKFQAALFHVQLTHRLEQCGLVAKIQAQLAVQPRQTLLHRLMGEQRVPAHRQQAVPGRTRHQQHGIAPQMLQCAIALIGRDHAVDRENQGGLGNGPVALTERTEHDQREGGKRQAGDEQPGVWEQQFDGDGGDAEAQQRHQQCIETAQPAVVGFRQRAGDDAEEQRNDQCRLPEIPAQTHAAGHGDQYAQAVAELLQRPQAT